MSASRYSRYLHSRELNRRKKNEFNSKYSRYGIFNQIRNRYRNSEDDVEDLNQTAKSESDYTVEPENLSKSSECENKQQRSNTENIATNNLPPNCDDLPSCSTTIDLTIDDCSSHEIENNKPKDISSEADKNKADELYYYRMWKASEEAKTRRKQEASIQSQPQTETIELPTLLEMFEKEVKHSKCETVTLSKQQTEAVDSSAVSETSDGKCEREQKRKSCAIEMADEMVEKVPLKKSKTDQILHLHETQLTLGQTGVGESNISSDGLDETKLANTCDLQLDNQLETMEERDEAFLDQLNNISNQLENFNQNYSDTNSEVDRIIRENLYYNYINM